MSHHGHNPADLTRLSAMFEALEEHQKEINGTHPDGKLTDSDEGALSIGVSTMGDKVVMAFGEATNWVGLTPDQAADIGLKLIKRAREAGLSKPMTIEI